MAGYGPRSRLPATPVTIGKCPLLGEAVIGILGPGEFFGEGSRPTTPTKATPKLNHIFRTGTIRFSLIKMNGLQTLLIVAAALYFLPALIGLLRGHHNFMSLLMLNLFLGWTFVGWVAALIWSFAANPVVDVKQVLSSPVLPKTTEVNRERRPCPTCAEMILMEAKKCRFCGEVFEKAISNERTEPRLVARRDRL